MKFYITMWRYVTKWDDMWRNVTMCDEMWRYVLPGLTLFFWGKSFPSKPGDVPRLSDDLFW